MNKMVKRNLLSSSPRRSAGMALLDILLAVVIFVIGMLALAHLQGNLSRSAGDASTRTVAANIGEEIVEALRAYQARELIVGDACPTTLVLMKDKKVFECVNTPSSAWALSRGGIDYTVNLAVTDWYFKGDGQTLTDDKTDSDLSSRDLSVPDFKELFVTVDWTAREFQIDQTQTSGLGSGTFTATSIVPSIPVMGSARVAAKDPEKRGSPPVEYTPGEAPDVVAINLDGTKFKESSTPMPEVIRSDYIVETWFDVVTYNVGADSSVYLRREEFAVVACECTLHNSAGGEGDGFLPTTWNGESFTEGEWVNKQWGESANNQQSQYCDTCCRDHHDVSGDTNADTLYRPSTGSAHGHYMPTRRGEWEIAGDGDDYLEVCRMVRKDGFMRVAQDFEQKGLVATRQAFFTDTTNVTNYSTHVTDEALSEFRTGSNNYDDGMTLPGDSNGNAIPLPRADLAEFDQQVSRALYTDYVNQELQDVLDCLAPTYDASCAPPGVTTPIEVLPFYEIQTTWLSFWRDNVEGDPVFMTNETIEDDNSHSRGEAQLTRKCGPHIDRPD
jgi:hypothetical protein